MAIDNVVNYIWFNPSDGTRVFSYHHYLCVRSALLTQKPDVIRFHIADEPKGEWWPRIRPHVELHTIERPESVAGQKLYHPAHQADVARMEILYRNGGIYFDTDVLVLRPLTPLLHHPTVMGREAGDRGLCPAVLMAERESPFIRMWLEGYDPARSIWQGFRSKGHDEHWNEMSVRYPRMLAERHPSLIHLEPEESFFWPYCLPSHLKLLFLEPPDTSLPPEFIAQESARLGVAPAEMPAIVEQRFANAFCIHLWETIAHPLMRRFNPTNIGTSRSWFARLARRFAVEDPGEPRGASA
jgi:hypothetical protein